MLYVCNTSLECELALICSANGAGTGVATVYTGRIMDAIYRREKRRVGGDHREFPNEFRLERARFMVLPVQAG